MIKAEAKLKNLRVAPRKVRRISDVIKGQSVNEAFAQLQMMTWQAAPNISKLLKSAVTNAKDKKMDMNKLFIESMTVDQGPMFKRYLPRAMGRATLLQKKMSHVSIVLGEREQSAEEYRIYEKPKKEHREKIKKESKPKYQEKKVVGREEKQGLFKSIFRRKAI